MNIYLLFGKTYTDRSQVGNVSNILNRLLEIKKMIKEILIVGLGSFAGGALRYGLSVVLSKTGRLWAFPIGIMVVNVLGCFLIGLLYSYFKHKASTDPVLPLLLMTGVLGGFTTFSTFSFETVQLLQQNEWLKATLYVAGSVGLGILACFLGMKLFTNIV